MFLSLGGAFSSGVTFQGWDLTNITEVQSIGGTISNQTGLHVSNDGTRLYQTGNGVQICYQYSMSTPYDLNTISFVNSSNLGNASVKDDIYLTPNGEYAYWTSIGNGYVGHKNLLNPFDITSSGEVGVVVGLGLSSPTGIYVTEDGVNLYIGHISGINHYTMSTPFNIETATFVEASPTITAVQALRIQPDGSHVIVVQGGIARRYELPTPFSVATMNELESVSLTPETQGKGLSINADGTLMFTSGFSRDEIVKYELSP